MRGNLIISMGGGWGRPAVVAGNRQDGFSTAMRMPNGSAVMRWIRQGSAAHSGNSHGKAIRSKLVMRSAVEIPVPLIQATGINAVDGSILLSVHMGAPPRVPDGCIPAYLPLMGIREKRASSTTVSGSSGGKTRGGLRIKSRSL